MSDMTQTPLRLASWVHDAAKQVAAQRGVSLNQFYADTITREVSAARLPAKAAKSGVAFEATVRFTVSGGRAADAAAYQIADTLVGAGEAAGASAVSADVVRLAAMSPRPPVEA